MKKKETKRDKRIHLIRSIPLFQHTANMKRNDGKRKLNENGEMKLCR